HRTCVRQLETFSLQRYREFRVPAPLVFRDTLPAVQRSKLVRADGPLVLHTHGPAAAAHPSLVGLARLGSLPGPERLRDRLRPLRRPEKEAPLVQYRILGPLVTEPARVLSHRHKPCPAG